MERPKHVIVRVLSYQLSYEYILNQSSPIPKGIVVCFQQNKDGTVRISISDEKYSWREVAMYGMKKITFCFVFFCRFSLLFEERLHPTFSLRVYLGIVVCCRHRRDLVRFIDHILFFHYHIFIVERHRAYDIVIDKYWCPLSAHHSLFDCQRTTDSLTLWRSGPAKYPSNVSIPSARCGTNI